MPDWTLGTNNLDKATHAFHRLLEENSVDKVDWNEAQTRFHFIDLFLTNCLGWPRDVIHVERAEGREYTDYELGEPRRVIWEAKREGNYFDLPPNPNRRLVASLTSVMLLSATVTTAIKQVQSYCASRGVPFAVVCNGHQLIAFIAVRMDGTRPLDGNCLVCDGHGQLRQHFPKIWSVLSPQGISERRLLRLLTTDIPSAIPPKLSYSTPKYHEYRYKSNSQASLRTLADLLLEDLPHTPDLEETFYRHCYCESGALSQYALLSKSILHARYASLFDSTQPSPHITPLKPTKHTLSVTPEMLSNALARRPFVLLGDVGVGKTSFLKNLIYNTAKTEFANSIYIYIDLGSQAALATDLKVFVIGETENQLYSRYDIDIRENRFVRGVYNVDIDRFRKGIYGPISENEPIKFEEKLVEFLDNKLSIPEQHLRHSIQHIVRGRLRPIIMIIDNADQRNLNTQQDAFLVAQNFASQTDAALFIAVRPRTFHHSRRAGSLSAYPQKVFSISPPRPERVLNKRLEFALDIASGNLPVPHASNLRLNSPNLSLFIKALLNSLRYNTELVELLSNITGGNIREVVELVKNFIGSPNVDSDKIIRIMEEEGRYRIPVHEFSKSALLGDYSHYHEDSSLAMNVFDVRFPDQREHFLVLVVLGFLNHDESHRDNEGFVTAATLLRECQDRGFTEDQGYSAVRRMTNRRLIETTERVTFAEDAMGENALLTELPDAFRITTVGAYHLERWLGTFSYLDAMVFDTPIFPQAAMDEIGRTPQSFEIGERLERTLAFRSYLSDVWHESEVNTPYFDWELAVKIGNGTFESVSDYVTRRGGRIPTGGGVRRG